MRPCMPWLRPTKCSRQLHACLANSVSKSCKIYTFFVAIGAASTTALSGEQCWPRPAPASERMTLALAACGDLGAATDRRAKEVASLALLPLEPGF